MQQIGFLLVAGEAGLQEQLLKRSNKLINIHDAITNTLRMSKMNFVPETHYMSGSICEY